MPKLLHIAASPQPEDRSFSKRVAKEFVGAWQEANPSGEVDELDLWVETLPEFGATSASAKVKRMVGAPLTESESAATVAVDAAIRRFLGADRYLISLPMWNFHVPYKLKHYLDVIIQPGKTVGFDPAKGYFGLVPSERPVQLILASGDTYEPGRPLASMDFLRPYLTATLAFIGLTEIDVIISDATAFGPATSEPILAKAIEDAKVRARRF